MRLKRKPESTLFRKVVLVRRRAKHSIPNSDTSDNGTETGPLWKNRHSRKGFMGCLGFVRRKITIRRVIHRYAKQNKTGSPKGAKKSAAGALGPRSGGLASRFTTSITQLSRRFTRSEAHRRAGAHGGPASTFGEPFTTQAIPTPVHKCPYKPARRHKTSRTHKASDVRAVIPYGPRSLLLDR